MQNANQPETLAALNYIRIVLDKTKNNRALAVTIFKKLFNELPQQLDCIEDSLKVGDYENAREITHKMHGSVSFCGLTEMQEPAKKLEQSLTNRNYQTIAQDWLQLQQKVLKFTCYQESILADLGKNAI
jgi:HPt (histidine-containing phosphotransfer) domain-containing protein